MQRSAPGLKNARRRLTIRPPAVPTTETAKPILKERKPPTDPGPAPCKNARFSKLINLGRKNSPNSSASLPAAPGSVARRRGRRLLFTPARRAPALALAGLPGTFGGAHARSWPCVRRGGVWRARARGRSSAARGRGWEHVPGRRVGRRAQRGAGGRCSKDTSPAGASFSEHVQGTFSSLAVCRSAERACQHAASAHPTMAASAGNEGCTRRFPGTKGGRLSAVPTYSEPSVGRENCCSCCYCSLLRRGPGTATPSHNCKQPNMSLKESSGRVQQRDAEFNKVTGKWIDLSLSNKWH